MVFSMTSNSIRTRSSKKRTSANFTDLDLLQMTSGHKLCSIKFEDKNDCFDLLFYANPAVKKLLIEWQFRD
jgi:uncharacterized protein YkuJ